MVPDQTKENGIGFREEDAMKMVFGEDVLRTAIDDFDGSATEHAMFAEVYCRVGGTHDGGLNLHEDSWSNVVESSVLCRQFYVDKTSRAGCPSKNSFAGSSLPSLVKSSSCTAAAEDQHSNHKSAENCIRSCSEVAASIHLFIPEVNACITDDAALEDISVVSNETHRPSLSPSLPSGLAQSDIQSSELHCISGLAKASDVDQSSEQLQDALNCQDYLPVQLASENIMADGTAATTEMGQPFDKRKLANNIVKQGRKKSKRISEIRNDNFDSGPLVDLHASANGHCELESKELEKRPMHLENDASTSPKIQGSGKSLPTSISLQRHPKLKCKVANGTMTTANSEGDVSLGSGTEAHFCGYKSLADKKAQKRMPSLLESSFDGFSEESHIFANEGVNRVDLPHGCNSDMINFGAGTSFEAQSTKKPGFLKQPKGWKRFVSIRKCDFHINDEDLLISAIIKRRDFAARQKFADDSDLCPPKLRKLKSKHGASRSVIRITGKGGNHSLEGQHKILERRTVLCWLIASGVISLQDAVQYRNPKDGQILKDGFVTLDGILCNCCSKTLSVSDFMAHVSISPPQSLNLYFQSGVSYTSCQLEAWSSECLSRRNGACALTSDEDDSDDTCAFCGDGGELICCDNCPSTYHQACLPAQELPEGSWYCQNCICRTCGNLCWQTEETLSYVTCSQCGHKYHEKCNEKGLTCGKEGSDTWFCSRSCQQIYLGLWTRVGIKNSIDDGLSWTILRANHVETKLCTRKAAQRIADTMERNAKISVSLYLMQQCFSRMVDPRTGIDMIPHVLCNEGSIYARLNYSGFYTFVLEKDDEIISVASVRVHGNVAAELPFIATGQEYRRQGMCRRLIDSILKMLRSFGVRMLVLSAIPESLDTWISGFGFRPIEYEEKQQLVNMNLMLLPGTSLLVRRLDISEAEKYDEFFFDDFISPNGTCLLNGNEG